CAGGLFHFSLGEIYQIAARRLFWQAKLGSFWGRNDLWWNEIEPKPGVFEWAKADKVVREYAGRGMHLLGMLCYGSAWSGGTSHNSEGDRKKWQEWTVQMRARFTDKLYAFEIWNEPNRDRWQPSPDPDAYRELVRATWQALRPPGSTSPYILAGATAGFDAEFLQKFIGNAAERICDGISIHPYPT